MPTKPKIYLETSVISAYFDFKKQDAARKLITRRFWRQMLKDYQPVISDVVVVELNNIGQSRQAGKLLNQIKTVKKITTNKQIETLAKNYITAGVIRQNKLQDALHLAVAAVKKIDFMVSWNYKDLVRATQRRKIAEFHRKRKLPVPTIATPLEFLKI